MSFVTRVQKTFSELEYTGKKSRLAEIASG